MRQALGVLAAAGAAGAPPLPEVVQTLLAVRPSMPAVAAAVRDVLHEAGPAPTPDALRDAVEHLLKRADLESRTIAGWVARRIGPAARVATVSHSTLVARAMLQMRPFGVAIFEERPSSTDAAEMLTELRANSVHATLHPVAALQGVLSEVAAGVVGADAVFAGRAFVNRRGTAALAAALWTAGKPLFVLAERWKAVAGEVPLRWPEPDNPEPLLEVIPAGRHTILVGPDYAATVSLPDEVLAEARAALAGADGVPRALEILRARRPHFTSVYLYEVRDQATLVLTGWAGLPTEHTRISLDQGICGAAVREGRTLNVPDVRADPRYLACSVQTRSELVVPIRRAGEIVGEIDIDSDDPAAFTIEDEDLVGEVAALFAPHLPPSRPAEG